MVKSNASMEDSPSKTESPASTSKSVVSLIQINSISIDICCPMEEIELPVQEHFSIRGFVSGMRTKNSKPPSPFSSDVQTDASIDNLPPLSVPKFRWWQCSHCIPETVVNNQNDIAGTSSPIAVGKLPSNVKIKGNIAEPIPFQERQQPCNAEEYPSKRAGGPDSGSSGRSDGFLPLLSRRKKKLRSLADIMYEEKNSASGGYLVTGSASSNETHVTEKEEFRNPCRKKRTAREEMRENLETSYPMGGAKRLKVHLEPDKASRRVEIFDSETEAVASERLDLQVSSGVKQKKTKIFRKIEKQMQVDNGSRPVQPNDSELNATGSDSLEKHFMASKFSFDCSNASMLREESVPLYNGNIESSNSEFADAAIQDNITLDLSLSSSSDAERKLLDEKSMELRDIPDLNESIVEKTAMIQESQFPSVDEKIMNVPSTGTEANPVEGKRQADISSPYTVQSRENTAELGGSVDDIPMEIVELLAKNQQERALENSRQHFSPEMMTSSNGGSSAVYVDGIPAMINIPFSNMANAPSFANPNTGFVQGVLNFPQGKYSHPEASTSQFRLFTPLLPIQQYHAGYLDAPPIISGLRMIERANLLWHPLRKNMPFNCFPHPLPDQFSKGENICNKNSIEKTSSGSNSAYSNVDIPAMQLLSLTNLRNVSGSPLIQHPSFNPTEMSNQLLVGTPFFPLSKQLPHFLNGATFSGESFNRSPLPAQITAQKGWSRDNQSIEKHNPKQLHSPNDGTSQVCVLNRNPADFTILGTCNEYMITARALKFNKRNASKLKLPPKVPKRKWVRHGYTKSGR